MRHMYTALLLIPAFASVRPAIAGEEFGPVAGEVNKKLVKIFGSGGFTGLSDSGSGVLVSPKGHILTVATQLLDTQDLYVHLWDGRRYRAKVKYVEPELDLALLEMRTGDGENKKDDGPVDVKDYYDIPAELKKPMAQTGDWVLAFTNSFKIATRNEPMSLQRGVVEAFTKLTARRGAFEATFKGDVYYLDAITNNPGSAGGALTTRKGDLLGLIGKEFRNLQSDTWTNYAIPLTTKVDVSDAGKKRTLSLEEFVSKGIDGTYKLVESKDEKKKGPGAYHGIVFVPNVVQKTPAYIDRVRPGSPAAKAGLKPDDLLIYIDGEPIQSISAFQDMMSRVVPGEKVTLEVRRKEKNMGTETERLLAVEIELTEFPKKP